MKAYYQDPNQSDLLWVYDSVTKSTWWEHAECGKYHSGSSFNISDIRRFGWDVVAPPWMSTLEHTKDTNPKDAIGSTKPPIANVPLSVISEVGMALAEGQWKYGGYNWRVIGVRASEYWDATFRHLKAWWEGEDADPDSQLSHVTKAISALTVLRDAMIQDNWTDDRPPRSKQTPTQVSDQYKQMLERLKSLQPDPVSGYTQKGQDDVRQAQAEA